jgi:hypothetical protein
VFRQAISIILGIAAMSIGVSSETRFALSDPTVLQISDIFGLQQALNVRPVMGTGFMTNATAVIDPTGAIDGAQGNATDCVFVDGTSGPCPTSTQSSAAFADNEIPMGILNGINSSFTLADVPNPPSSLHVALNGVRLTPAIDYTLSGPVITFIGIDVPNAGDNILADYRY